MSVITKTNKTTHYAVQLCVLVMVRISEEGSPKLWKTADGLFYGINGTSIIAVLCKFESLSNTLRFKYTVLQITHTQPCVATEIISVYREC